MANTYTWNVNQLDAKIHEDGKDNVVYNVHFRYLAQDENNEKYAISQMGIYTMQYNEGDSFTPFDDLTETQVIGWLESGLDVEQMQESLSAEIELMKHPVDESLLPPWETPPPTK